ncbi:MAG TPA: FtsX-like permease family protein, partial [Bryobacteraceae bacterium]|nr:FtsX-like permease family protein [Bryobacteraceae bacterium]
TPIEQAQAELTALAPSFHAASPTANRNFRAVAVPLRQFLTGGVRHRVLLLAAFAGLILLISSANVAHLMLSRSVRRASELAIRLSLGATRRRLLRQLVTESLVLSSAAGVAGFVLALWAVRVLAFLVPDSMAMFVIMESAWATLSITAFLVVFTGLVCGLLPALRISSVNWNQAIRAGSPRVVGGFGQERLRGLLVVSEVALAVVLAVGASLLLRSLYEVLNVDPGFRAERILTAETSPGRTFWPLRERTAYIEEALRRIRSLPGVEAAAFMSAAPFTWKGGRLNFQIEGMQAQPEQGALNRQVTPDYFAALRIPVINGRAFTSQDRIGAAPVAVINERLAKLWFDGRNPIGHQVRIAGPKFADAGMRIVGVVGNVREMGLLRDPPPIIYVPHAQTEADFNVPFTLAVRTAGDPSQLVPALRSELAAGWAGMPVSRIRTLAQITEAEMADRRPVALLGTSLALLAVVLACVGVYGLLAFSISQRVPEIGIRMALGASRFVIASTIMRGAALLVGCGVLAGTIASAALTQTVRTVLYNIKPHDPMTFVAVPLVMLALAVLACLMPVRTALAVDPAIALRKD